MSASASAVNAVPDGFSGELSTSRRAPRTASSSSGAGGEEGVVGVADHGKAARAHQVHVVVVVPGGDGVDHGVARVDQGAVGGVQPGARAAGDQDRLQRIGEPQPLPVEVGHRAPQLRHPVGGGIVGLARPERPHDLLHQELGDGELGGGEVAHGEVADPTAPCATIARMSAAIRRISEPTSPSAMAETRGSGITPPGRSSQAAPAPPAAAGRGRRRLARGAPMGG
jgi:hypothetical protein